MTNESSSTARSARHSLARHPRDGPGAGRSVATTLTPTRGWDVDPRPEEGPTDPCLSKGHRHVLRALAERASSQAELRDLAHSLSLMDNPKRKHNPPAELTVSLPKALPRPWACPVTRRSGRVPASTRSSRRRDREGQVGARCSPATSLDKNLSSSSTNKTAQ